MKSEDASAHVERTRCVFARAQDEDMKELSKKVKKGAGWIRETALDSC
jgi:hypothetical protein